MPDFAESLLFQPIRIGELSLKNRVVMAPMTRNRANGDDAPHPLNARYYAQRASAGLIVTEASQVSPQGKGYPGTPGSYSPQQVEGWRLVTDAVHARGGRIFLQLWHVGRISHPSLQPGGASPVAPSAIPPAGNAMTASGPQPFVTPRALELAEIPGIVADFRRAAANAEAAGFDGVELHGANGYLLDQFLRDSTNKRGDAYGGPVANRARLLLEVAEAAAEVLGAGRVGVRLSPLNPFNDIADSDPRGTFGGKVILNGGFDRAEADAALAAGIADLIAFGTAYLANPDLAERLRQGAALNPPQRETFYGGDERGYIDYPSLEGAA